LEDEEEIKEAAPNMSVKSKKGVRFIDNRISKDSFRQEEIYEGLLKIEKNTIISKLS